MLLVIACGVSTEDVEATVQARIASIPTPTPQIIIVEVEKEVVKEVAVEVEVIKEIPLEVVTVEVIKEVEKIVYVLTSTIASVEGGVTATPIPEPTVAQGNVYEWDDISLEFENNALVANSKYLNQTISIRGEIYDIDYRDGFTFTEELSDFGEEIPTVTLKASNSANRLHCGLENLDEVANLSVDDTVIVNGKIGKWEGHLPVYPCSIVD